MSEIEGRCIFEYALYVESENGVFRSLKDYNLSNMHAYVWEEW